MKKGDFIAGIHQLEVSGMLQTHTGCKCVCFCSVGQSTVCPEELLEDSTAEGNHL